MEKTILYAKPEPQIISNSSEIHHSNCPNCNKLQTQIANLTSLLWKNEINEEDFIEDNSQALETIQNELVNLRKQYDKLKRNLLTIQKENDELFTENTQLRKQIESLWKKINQNGNGALKVCRFSYQLTDITNNSGIECTDSEENCSKATERPQNIQRTLKENGLKNQMIGFKNIKTHTETERESNFKKTQKSKEIEIFVEREKVVKLEQIVNDLRGQICQLKELLRKRNCVQKNRHQVIIGLQELLCDF